MDVKVLLEFTRQTMSLRYFKFGRIRANDFLIKITDPLGNRLPASSDALQDRYQGIVDYLALSDLSDLPIANEPEILRALHARLDINQPFTRIGKY